MKSIIIILLSVFGFTCVSCNHTTKKENIIPPDWIELNLPNGWTLHTPKNFYAKALQGVDSEPGVIDSKQDSIYLQFDSGIEMLKREKCNFQNDFERTKDDIENGFYRDFYKVPTIHTAYIDTIDNKIAVVVKPTREEHGTVGISISDCQTGKWLGITGTNMTIEKEKLILEIFKTIKLTKKH